MVATKLDRIVEVLYFVFIRYGNLAFPTFETRCSKSCFAK